MRRLRTDGFTIVELLFAMAVFSFVLLAASAAVIQISRMFFKGTTAARTQSLTRQVMDDISRPIQFTGTAPIILHSAADSTYPERGVLCIGRTRYTYAIDSQVTDAAPDGTYDASKHQIRHALWRDTLTNPASCLLADLRKANPDDTLNDESQPKQELLGTNMRLTKFNVVLVDPASLLYRVDIGIAYGNEDVLDKSSGSARCNGGILSVQFCALSELQTFVTRRTR